MTLSTFERTHRADHGQEHALLLDSVGRVIVERGGDADSVPFTPQELSRAAFGTLSHNHPRALPMSGDDLALAARYGLTLRAVGVTEDGARVDYTVRFSSPSERLATSLRAEFAVATSATEKMLAQTALSDLAWRRESRHLALTSLARQFGFTYQRTTSAPVGEMQHEARRLDGLADVEVALRRDALAPLVARIVHVLSRNADSRGVVGAERLNAVRNEAGRQVVLALLGKPNQDGALVPYNVQHSQVVPDSPYFAALWSLMRAAATAAVNQQAAIMRRHLPPDLVRQFEYATLSPFEAAVHEMDDEDPPGLIYDPLHLWLAPDGKQLSDRIWQAAGDMRVRLNAYLTQAIARAVPVSQMARDLEQFLVDGKGGYEALRLARTETSAAYHRASALAAQLNPFVDTYDFFTAPEHQCCDQCDEIQNGGPYSKDDMNHLPPAHPHCICSIRWNEVSDAQKVAILLRQKIDRAVGAARRAMVDYVGPLSKLFLDLLFRGKP